MTILLGILVLVVSAGFMVSAVVANDLVREAKDKGCSVVDNLQTDLQ